MATVSKLLKIIGLFCRISSLLEGSFAKETYNFKAHTNRSQPIVSDVKCDIQYHLIVMMLVCDSGGCVR